MGIYIIDTLVLVLFVVQLPRNGKGRFGKRGTAVGGEV